jgi:hypothetical protein
MPSRMMVRRDTSIGSVRHPGGSRDLRKKFHCGLRETPAYAGVTMSIDDGHHQ